MTEQEKQGYLKIIESYSRITNDMEDDYKLLQKKLDERDREVERLNDECQVLIGFNNSYKDKNQRLRKALEKITRYPEIDTCHGDAFTDVYRIAAKALSGEEK